MRYLVPLIAVFAFTLASCSEQNRSQADHQTWDESHLKTRTSPDQKKRARADVDEHRLRLFLGEPSDDNTMGIWILYTKILDAPKGDSWDMRWADDHTFILEHPQQGTRQWKVKGVGKEMIFTEVTE